MLAKAWQKVENWLSGASFWVVAAFALIAVSLFWGLGNSLKSNFLEEATIVASTKLGYIWHWPLNLPHKLLQNLFMTVGLDNQASMRFASTVFGLFFLISTYLVIRNWFGRFIASLGTLFMAGTPFFLIISRSSTSAIMLLSPLILIAYVLSLHQSKKQIAFCLGLILLLAFSLYSPGSLWAILILGFFVRKDLKQQFAKLPKVWLAGFCTVLILLLVPLVIAFFEPGFLKTWLLLPQPLPIWSDILKNLAWGPVSYFLRTENGSIFLVGTAAIFTLSQTVFLILGFAAMVRQARREMYWLVAFVLLALALYGLNGLVAVLLIGVPSIIILVSAGMRYLYTEWRSVFPYNPLPRTLAILLLSAVCLQQLVFSVHYAHKVWPHTVQAKGSSMLRYTKTIGS